MKNIDIDTFYCNGDSWAYGSELKDISDSFVNVMARSYNLPIVNAACPGGSNQRIVRTTILDISKLLKEGKKPFVLITWTYPHRFEFYSTEKKDYAIFSSPTSADDLDLGNLIWSKWSSEKTDVIHFLIQVVALQSFLKQNDVPYFMTNVFKVLYEKLNQEEIELFHSQIDTTYFMYNLPLKVLLTPYINIEWGTYHPLKEGHAIIAKFLIEQIDIRYKI